VEATRKVAEFGADTRYSDLPPEVIVKSKERILDTMGCMIAGCREDLAPLMVKYAEETGGMPEASIVGFGSKTSASNAALVNGTLGHALDFDDTQTSFGGHPSTVILPAALSLGEKLASSGKQVLEAYVVGFESACKIGRGVNPRLYANGWHGTSVVGTFGAAVAAGKLLRLDPGRMASALGLAASQSCGLRENFGTMTKPFHAGRASQSGVLAALLAKDGFTASQQVLEAKRGFCAVFSGEYDLAKITEALGDPYDILSPGVHTKPYPSCLFTHTIIDATLFLAETYDIRPEDVNRVQCWVAPIVSDVLIHANPQTGLQGKFSAQYAVAVSLLNRTAFLDHFTDSRVRTSEAQSMIKKVSVVVRPDETGNDPPASTVAITLRNGREYTTRVEVATGNPEKPMTLNQLITKYRICAETRTDRAGIDQSIDRILHFERLSRVSDLMKLIAAKPH